MQRIDVLGAVRALTYLIFFPIIAGCGGGSDEDARSALALDAGELVATTVTGSVGDGPITSGRVVIENSSGQVLATQRSNEQANYRIQLNAGRNEFPLLVRVDDGIDIVTGDAPSFELVSAIMQSEGEQIVNLNPFGTLAVKVAQRMDGGLNTSNLDFAVAAVKKHLGFGIDARNSGNPMFIVLDEQNTASVVRSSEALGEVVRRVFASSLSGGQFGSPDEVIDAVSSDLTDGVLDGRGAEGADTRLAATMSIVSAQVLLEVMVNRLEVGGTVATQSLDSAVQQIVEGNLTAPLTSTLGVTDSMLSQAGILLDAATRIDDNPALEAIRGAVAMLRPGQSSGQVAGLLPMNAAAELDATVQQVSLTTEAELEVVNSTVSAGNPPADDPINRLPTISGFPAIEIMAGSMYEFAPIAGDADGDELTFAVSGRPAWAEFDGTTGRLSGIPDDGDVGTSQPIQISVSDSFGVATLPVFRITVVSQPNQRPEISGSAPTGVTVGNVYDFTPTVEDPDGDELSFTVTNLPRWASFDPATGRVQGVPAVADAGVSMGIQIGVSDGEDRASLAPFTITVSVVPNQAPVISGNPNTQALVGNNYVFTPSASDTDGDPLAYTVTGLPDWAGFDPATGRLSGSPTIADEGDHAGIRISVSDGMDSAALPPFSIAVLPIPNAAPTISGSPSTSAQVGAQYSFMPMATDADGDPLTFSISSRPAWASFDSGTGRLHGMPSAGDEGVHADIRISVTDGWDTAALPIFAILVEGLPNMPPQISGTPPASVTAGESYNFMPSASDADGDALSFTIENLPSWASFDVASGRLQGAPTAADAGGYPDIRISVTDGEEAVSLPDFQVTVSDAPNEPPLIGGQPATQVTAGQSYAFTPTASDPDGDPLSFSIAGRPAWASFDTTSGRLSGGPGNADAGVYSNIRISVSDGSDTVALPAFSIAVAGPPNQPPSIVGSPATQVTVDQQYSFSPSASDPDGDTLNFSVTGRPSWASFDSATGRLIGTPTDGAEGTYSGISISVSDGEASASLSAFSIVVAPRPNAAPSISGTPAADATVGAEYSFRPSASDPDGDVLSFSIIGMPAWGSFDGSTGRLSGTPSAGEEGTYSGVRISVSDGQDSASLPAFAIAVQAVPNQPPSISGAPATQVSVNTAYAFTPSASDPDGDALSFSIVGMPDWASFDSNTGRLSGTPLTGEEGAYSGIRISVSDGEDSATLAAFAIDVLGLPNRPPTIAGSPPSEVVVDSAFDFAPDADDPDGDALTFSVTGLPAWASFDSATGRVSGAPGLADIGEYAGITITVSDGIDIASMRSFSVLVVEQTFGYASVSWLAPVENTDGTVLDDLAGFNIHYGPAINDYSHVENIDDPTVTSHLVENLTPGTWYFVVTAYDTSANESVHSNVGSKIIP